MVRIDPEMIREAAPPGKRGRQPDDSDAPRAIDDRTGLAPAGLDGLPHGQQVPAEDGQKAERQRNADPQCLPGPPGDVSLDDRPRLADRRRPDVDGGDGQHENDTGYRQQWLGGPRRVEIGRCQRQHGRQGAQEQDEESKAVTPGDPERREATSQQRHCRKHREGRQPPRCRAGEGGDGEAELTGQLRPGVEPVSDRPAGAVGQHPPSTPWASRSSISPGGPSATCLTVTVAGWVRYTPTRQRLRRASLMCKRVR